MRYALLLLGLVGLVIVSGCTTDAPGAPEAPHADGSAFRASVEAWLTSTDQGMENFPGGSVGEVWPAFGEGTDDVKLWLAHIVDNDGQGLGFVLDEREEFGYPLSFTKYANTRELFSIDAEHAMISIRGNNTQQKFNDFTGPYLVVREGMGYYWASDIYADGEYERTEYIKTWIE